MKRLLIITLVLAFLLTACAGQASEPQAPADTDSQAATDENVPADSGGVEVEPASEPETGNEAGDEVDEAVEPASAESGEEPTNEAGDGSTGTETGGLPVNPDPMPKGEPFVVEGSIVNVSMIPADAPQFLIEAPTGVRYRLNAQPVSEIYVEDGTQLQAFQIKPSLRVRATVLLPADATAADVASTEDLVILSE